MVRPTFIQVPVEHIYPLYTKKKMINFFVSLFYMLRVKIYFNYTLYYKI
jgi:hypothetical protein